MPLNTQQQQTFQTWLGKHNPNFTCPCCGGRNFNLGDIILPPTVANGAIAMGGPGIPMVQVVCATCAHVTLFASMPIGL